jgi:hypothetical protein
LVYVIVDRDDGILGNLRNVGNWIVGGGAAFFVFDAFAGGFDVFLSLSGTLFPMFAVASGTLSSEIAFLDTPLVHQGLIVVALAYLLNLGIQLVQRVRQETD